MTTDIAAALPQVTILTPTDGKAYETSIKRWCENSEKKAKFVVLPKSAEEVSQAIRFAINNDLEIAIKGGGHSTSGASSTEGLVVDLAHLNTVSVDAEARRIVVGGGALWSDVNDTAIEHGLATVGGAVSHTGVGGLTVGGGYGWLSAKYGLAIDLLEEAQVVLASGEIVTCNETQNSDLFWGIRGAGSNFGPVTSFTFRAFPQTNFVWSGMLVYPPTALEAVFKAASTWIKGAGEDESALIVMACPPPNFKPMLAVVPFYNGSSEEAKKKFSAFYDVGPVADMTKEMPYPVLNTLQNPMTMHGGRRIFKATVITSLEHARFQQLFDAYAALTAELPETVESSVLVELIPYAKIVSVPTSTTAFGNRGKWYNVNYSMRWRDAALDSRIRGWSTEQVEYLRSEEQKGANVDLTGKRAYANYGLGDERARDVFGENYERLTEVKAKYDPQNVFHKWFPITPKKS